MSGQDETFYYGKTEYEASPLHRVDKIYSPGNNWVNQEKGVKTQFGLNTDKDDVKLWRVTEANYLFGSYAVTGAYNKGQLYKNITLNENDKQVIEFEDKEGRLILKKVQLTARSDDGSGAAYSGWLCTYYIYDDMGYLRCAIQPKAVEQLSNNGWIVSIDILNELTFRYAYDEQGKMIVKKVPGAGEMYMVYDARDRLVMTQDANMRNQGKWFITLYDELNRPVQSGMWLNSQSNTFHKDKAFNSIVYPFSIAPFSHWEPLSITHYDDYAGLPSRLSNTLNMDYINGANFNFSYNSSPEYAQEITQSKLTKGMVTWTQLKVLGENKYISSVNIYDAKGRVIQVQSTNLTGGVDIVTNQYDFAGRVLRMHAHHQKLGKVTQNYNWATLNTYDDLGRLVKSQKKINNNDWKTIASMEYDALGQLKKKGFLLIIKTARDLKHAVMIII